MLSDLHGGSSYQRGSNRVKLTNMKSSQVPKAVGMDVPGSPAVGEGCVLCWRALKLRDGNMPHLGVAVSVQTTIKYLSSMHG